MFYQDKCELRTKWFYKTIKFYEFLLEIVVKFLLEIVVNMCIHSIINGDIEDEGQAK